MVSDRQYIWNMESLKNCNCTYFPHYKSHLRFNCLHWRQNKILSDMVAVTSSNRECLNKAARSTMKTRHLLFVCEHSALIYERWFLIAINKWIVQLLSWIMSQNTINCVKMSLHAAVGYTYCLYDQLSLTTWIRVMFLLILTTDHWNCLSVHNHLCLYILFLLGLLAPVFFALGVSKNEMCIARE